MQSFKNTDYSPSATWNEFLQNLLWQQDNYVDSAYRAFKEAIRRGISRSDVFFDVAEAIHRAYGSVNWGALRWRWKLALQESDHGSQSNIPAPTSKNPPTPPSYQRSLPAAKGSAAAEHHGQHNGTARHSDIGRRDGKKPFQRGGSSLISYYA
jgi:hypothetical protein